MIKLRPIRKKVRGNGASLFELDVVSEVLVVAVVLAELVVVEVLVEIMVLVVAEVLDA